LDRKVLLDLKVPKVLMVFRVYKAILVAQVRRVNRV
jgi:hypothetical protein